MSHKVIKTSNEDEYGVIEFHEDNKTVFIGTSSTSKLYGMVSTEEFLAEYYSQFDLEGENRKFDWKKDIPDN